jgi:hypothetical protein
MGRADFVARSAAAVRQPAWLVPLLLLFLNAGFYAWSQGALAMWGLTSVSAQQGVDGDIAPGGMRLLTADEGLQVQARAERQAREAQAAAQAAAQEAAQAQAAAQAKAQDKEMVLEFESARKAPSSAPGSAKTKRAKPIVKLKLKNPRRESER